MDALTGSRGRIAAVSDEQILDAYQLLASREGVFCEPASAASVAGILAHGLPAPEGGEPPDVGRLRAHGPRLQGPRHGARQGAGGGRLRGGGRGGRAGRSSTSGPGRCVSFKFFHPGSEPVCAPRAQESPGSTDPVPMLAEPPAGLGRAAALRSRAGEECALRRAALRGMRVRAARARAMLRAIPGLDADLVGRALRGRLPGIWWWRSSSARGWPSAGRAGWEIAERAPAGLLDGVIVPVPPAPVRRLVARVRRGGERSRAALSVETGCRSGACLRRSQGRRQVGRPRRSAWPPRPGCASRDRRPGRRPGGRRGHDRRDARRLRAGACVRRLRTVRYGSRPLTVRAPLGTSGHPGSRAMLA